MSKSLMIKSDRLKKVRKSSKATVAKKSANRKSVGTRGTIAEERPDLLEEWDWEKNDAIGLDPRVATCGSMKKAWWVCKEHGHKWEAALASRARLNSGCPVCSGRVPDKGVNDFATLMPDVAKEWHPTKNGDMTASDVTLHSGRRVWWQDQYGHEWIATPASRAVGTGCPTCKNRGKTSFPEVAAYFYIIKEFPDAMQHHNPSYDDFGNMSVDIWIPSIRTAVEYDGEAWHQEEERDLRKDMACFNNGIRLIRIREPNCINYQSPLMTIIVRDGYYDNGSLTKAIRELMHELGASDDDVDVDRDEDAIIELMGVVEYKRTPAYLFPDVANEWNREKNGSLTPYMFTPGSSKKVWWVCGKCGNEWKTAISVRCIDGCGCPECGRKTISLKRSMPKSGRSLADKRPEIAAMWHPTKNGMLTPNDVTMHSKRIVWWVCPKCGDEWQQSVIYRCNASRSVCGKCSRVMTQSVPKDGRSFGDVCPDIAKEWLQEKNGDMTPFDVKPLSTFKAWWKCPKCGNEWQTKVENRTRHGNCLCASCNRRRPQKPIIGKNDLLSQKPDVAENWDYERNGGLCPQDVKMYSNHKFWWKCKRCGEQWQMSAYVASNGRGCPLCTKERAKRERMKVSAESSLAMNRPDLMLLWNMDRNVGYDPSEVAAKSNFRFWWKCDKGHEWQAAPNDMHDTIECHCPICADRKLLTGYNDLETKFPEIASEFDCEKNGGIKPSEVKYNSSTRYWWKCRTCGYEWKTIVRNRTIDGRKCRSCSQRARHQRDRDERSKGMQCPITTHPAEAPTQVP